ncbi:hypothetical protein [Hymenobacter profundi]|uniref:Uncharacterized protein n=1 Tax=Hymenobacter profundi TaxID=1982110 RepID=A0ABS6WVG1_9BACT|nr:hypothetical protein [Hymenobacter profundi]MBW3127608.1 hypothetical protein [Hymenobacter profundi]
MGLAIGYTFEKIKPFVLSLIKCQYKGKLVLIADDNLHIPPEVKMQLDIDILFEPVFRKTIFKRLLGKLLMQKPAQTAVHNYLQANIGGFKSKFIKYFIYLYERQTARYAYYYNYLINNEVYDKILITDVRDVVFQQNPFLGLDSILAVFREAPGVKLIDQSHNRAWIEQGFGKKVLSQMASEPIFCSGTIMGTYDGILNFLRAFMKTCIEHKIPLNILGMDQGIFNYMIFCNVIPFAEKYDNGNIVLTINSELEDKMELKDKLLTYNKYTPNILHQYDRVERFNKYFYSDAYFKNEQICL